MAMYNRAMSREVKPAKSSLKNQSDSFFFEVIPTRLFHESSGVLTYSFSENLSPGTIVEIPIGKSSSVGIVSKRVTSVDFPTKPISKTLYSTPLPPHILKSIFWLSDYYLVPLPQVAKLFLPVGIGKSRRKKTSSDSPKTTNTANESSQNLTKTPQIPLNPAQKKALQAIQNASTPTKLLHGVTGSGKTNIYLKLAENALKEQRSVILLVPEIALTSQLVQVFKETFLRQITLIHSRQTEANRHLIWESILNSTTPQIIIGPRSALLSPVKDLGLIIIDEAHESTYFQENTPKYSTLRLASFIASSTKTPCIFGTATPLVTDYYLAKSKSGLISLDVKAKNTAINPKFHITNLCDPLQFTKNRYFSDDLLDAIENNLKNHHQTLIFHNRRGSAPLTICENCGWQALCPNCFLPLTLHSDSFELLCHTCGHKSKVPTSCPDCNHTSIIHKGFGTKLLESELSRLFKNARIARFDADNSKTDTLDAKYDEVKNGDVDIIIGTQTIAKGLDLPLLATVGIVQADSGLSLPDYASEERTFHLLTQVIGRVGRGHLDAANVFIQTYQPDHPVISTALKNDYTSFYHHTLSQRKKGHFPPFYYLAKITITYKTETTSIKYARELHRLLSEIPSLYVSSPTPAFHERTARGYTWQIIIRARSRKTLLHAASSLPKGPKISISFDPPSTL